jgi:hypothetical protein
MNQHWRLVAGESALSCLPYSQAKGNWLVYRLKAARGLIAAHGYVASWNARIPAESGTPT